MPTDVRLRIILDGRDALALVSRLDAALDGLSASATHAGSRTGAAFKNPDVARGGAIMQGVFQGIGQRAVDMARDVARAAARVAVELAQLGADLGETDSKFVSVFEGASEAVDTFLDDFANKAGLTRGEARGLAADVGSIGRGAGLAGDDLSDFSTRVLEAAGDLTSFSNVPIAETFAAIRSGLTGESEPLKRFGIFLSEATIKQEALKVAKERDISASSQQAKELAALNLIYRQMGANGSLGDLNRTQDSAANRARRLTAVLREQREQLARELVPTYALVVDTLSEAVDGSKDLASTLVSTLARAIYEVTSGVVGVGRALGDGIELLGLFGTAGANTGDVVDGMGGLFDMLRQDIESVNFALRVAVRLYHEAGLRLWQLRQHTAVGAEEQQRADAAVQAHTQALRSLERAGWDAAFSAQMNARRDAERREALRKLSEGLQRLTGETRDYEGASDDAGGSAKKLTDAERRRREELARLERQLRSIHEIEPAPLVELNPEQEAELQFAAAMARVRAWRQWMQENVPDTPEAPTLDAGVLPEVEIEAGARSFEDRWKEAIGAVHVAMQDLFGRDWQKALDDGLMRVQQFADAFGRILAGVGESRLQEIGARERAEMEAFDREEERLNRRFRRMTAEERAREALQQQREAAQRRYEQERAAAQRRQAKRQKALAIFTVAIETAVNIVKAFPNPLEMIAAAALGALQIAAIKAQPIPEFRRGVDGFEGGLAKVHAGELLVNLPGGTNVLTNENAHRVEAAAAALVQGPDRPSARPVLEGLTGGAAGGAAGQGLDERAVARAFRAALSGMEWRQRGRDLVAIVREQEYFEDRMGLR